MPPNAEPPTAVLGHRWARERKVLWVALVLVVVWVANFRVQKVVFTALSPGGFLLGRYLLMPVAAALLLSSVGVAAQTPRSQPPRDRAAAAPNSDLSALANGWGALAAGRWQEAVAAADSVLSRRPGDHRAVDLKIEALAPGVTQ